ncbi:conserved hypothetical protein [Neospora caninum Liverpool]|uniref:Phosphodiesterase/alkaline phosphatase D family protein n=1 Tax=Neospora caninum (strain Liverpool) TaxID=572307 RepID=F0VBA9_NEOCL|nr:conserved hypothetical protein [Neospora caninum Liverpool]CBZ50893.1 conserved hypothetical protein [Neospora caninum Liverpool]CEL68195.1 TPA: phosphodiesterase/alkaline phosphatase D family protein [Neospora caninum Liverpool]|eukprot:XP_003880926.1 conserved hypothetical protein [Neospora caninum Liverpool]
MPRHAPQINGAGCASSLCTFRPGTSASRGHALCRWKKLDAPLLFLWSVLVAFLAPQLAPLPSCTSFPRVSAANVESHASAGSADVNSAALPRPAASPVAPSSSSALAGPDRVQAFPLRRLAFGSCFSTHEQRSSLLSPLRALFMSETQRVEAEEEKRRELKHFENDVWIRLQEQHPDAWIWMGDAGYSRSHDVAAVRLALEQVKRVSPYRDFRRSLQFLDGTWDDHDYGMNDGGKYQKDRERLRQAFLDFLDVPENSRRRQGRRGVYSSHVFGIPEARDSDREGDTWKREKPKVPGERRGKILTEGEDAAERERESGHEGAANGERREAEKTGEPNQIETNDRFYPGTEVKLILLDTRHERDDHFIPSAVSFCFRCLRRLGGNYEGDLLGEEQWRWLESQLTNSTASVHLVVSSIQVSTSLPIVESWGHFPRARQRLINLLERTKPAGLVFLSGDVHFGEISGDERNILEITSSGMTHTAGDSFLKRLLVEKVILPFYNAHRRQPRDVYVHRNFGLLDFRYLNAKKEEIRTPADAARLGPVAFVDLDMKIADARTGAVALSAKQTFPAAASLAEAPRGRDTGDTPAFVSQSFSEFSAHVPHVVPHPTTWIEALVLWFFWPIALLVCPVLLGYFVLSLAARTRPAFSARGAPGSPQSAEAARKSGGGAEKRRSRKRAA